MMLLYKAAARALFMVGSCLGEDRVLRLLQTMRASRHAAVGQVLEHLLERELPDNVLSQGFVKHYFQPPRGMNRVQLAQPCLSQAETERLHAIPSETTEEERLFLYQFFKTLWPGQGDVIEIGPFLGGTTRAICMGMAANPRKGAEARMITCDRFEDYHVEDLKDLLEPLVERGVLSQEQLDGMGARASFRELYKAIHADSEYAPFLEVASLVLPDHPGQDELPNVYHVQEGQSSDAVFIDGAKSWYGMRHCMIEFARITRPGSFYIFQDYGWYTCFWLPVCMALLGDAFELYAGVDNTYVFQQVRPVEPGQVADAIPAAPDEVGLEALLRHLDRLAADAAARNDTRGEIGLLLQRVAAMAYLGEKDQAVKAVNELKNSPFMLRYSSMILAAEKSPTYFPSDLGGPVYLS